MLDRTYLPVLANPIWSELNSDFQFLAEVFRNNSTAVLDLDS